MYQAPSIIGSVAPHFITRSSSPINYKSTGDQVKAAQVKAALANPQPGCLMPASAYALHHGSPTLVPTPFLSEPMVPPGYNLEQQVHVVPIGVEDNQTLVNNTPAPPSPHFPVPPIPAAAYHDLPVRPSSTLALGENQDFTALGPDPHGASLNPNGNPDNDEEENVEPFDNHPVF